MDQKEIPEKAPGREYRISTEDEIDLMEIFFFFWDRRITIGKMVGFFFVLGVFVVLFSRVEYQASATFVPETQSTQSSAGNLLQRYGGMLGVGGGGQIGGGGISTGLYPDIISSLPYQVELTNEPLYFSSMDTTLTLREYFQDRYPLSAIDYVKKYTLGLPSQIINLFSSSEESNEQSSFLTKVNRDSVVSLPSVQRSAAGKLASRINIEQDEGLVTLTAELPDSRAAAELGQAAIELLKEYVREYKTQKAGKELEFVREQVKEAKKRFEEAQMKLAEFRDSNINLATAKAQTREQELQSEYDLTFDIYNRLAQNLEQAKLKVQEDTPVFTTIEPFQVPTSNSKPNTGMILLASVFIGLIVGIIFVIIHKIWAVLHWQIHRRDDRIVQAN